MQGAAPRSWRVRSAVVALGIIGLALQVSSASAHTDGAAASRRTSAFVPMWSVQLTQASSGSLSLSRLAALRSSGIRVLLVDVAGWKASKHAHVISLARQANFRLIEPTAPPKGTTATKRLRSNCAASSKPTLDRCAVQVQTVKQAQKWLGGNSVDFVVLRVASPKSFLGLGRNRSKRARLLVVLPLAATVPLDSSWQQVVNRAAQDPSISIAVLPSGMQPAGALDAYAKLVSATQTKTAAGIGSGDATAPSTPTGLQLVANGRDFVTVQWVASTDDVGVIGYHTFLNGKPNGDTTAVSAKVSGLQCATVYSFGVEAYDSVGNSSPLASINVSTQSLNGCSGSTGGGGSSGGGGGGTTPPATDIIAPSSPLGLAQQAQSATSVTLGWSPSTDNVGVAGYVVYKGATLAGTTVSTSYVIAGLTCGTSYAVGVDAYDGAGNHSPPTSFTISTIACSAADTQAPTTPTGLAATSSTPTSISVSWTASTDNVGVTGYGVYQNGASLGSVGAGTTSRTFSSLTCGTSYTLAVDAVDAAGNRSTKASISASSSACPDVTPPTTPTGLAATGSTQTSISVSWTASTDNVGVTGYGVYQNGTSVGSVGAGTTSRTFSSLVCGTSYTLAVDAVDAAGNRSIRTSISASTSACSDTTPPTTPTGLATTSSTQTSISVSWTASTDNVGVTGYGVYRNGTSVGSVGSGTTSQTFSLLTCGTSYTLAVDAVDAAGNRSAKASISASTSACFDTTPPTTPTGLTATGSTQTSISVSWTASTDNVGVTGYGVYQNGTSVGSVGSGTTTQTFSSLTCGTGYTLAVDAADAAGNRSGKATLTAATGSCSAPPPPPPPSGSNANLWVDTNGGTCTRQAAAGAYVDAQACGSLNAAYQAAQGGDTIDVKCGTYSNQTISNRSLGTNVVTIQKDPGDSSCSRVTVPNLTISSSYTFVSGFKGDGVATGANIGGFLLGGALNACGSYTGGGYPCALPYSHITIDNFSYNSGGVNGVSYATIQNGEIGPMSAQSGAGCTGPIDGMDVSGDNAVDNTGQPVDHLTVKYTYIHDITATSSCGGHTDAIQGINGYNNWTFDGDIFSNDATCILAYSPAEGNAYAVDTMMVENSVFMGNGSLSHCISIGNKGAAGSSACGSSNLNNIIQNNTFISGLTADVNCGGGPDGVFRNNIVIASMACSASGTDWSFDYNNFESGNSTCNGKSHSTTCTVSFATSDHSSGNVDLAGTDTCAKNTIPSNYPPTDIHGTSRPQGANADAGAMEVPGG